MSYEFYKIMHVTGFIMVFLGLAGILALRMSGPTLSPRPYRLFMITHGVGLLLAFVAGFGLAARLNMFGHLPMWVWGKIAIWLVLGGAIALAKRKGQIGTPILVLFVGLACTAAWLAITKPF